MTDVLAFGEVLWDVIDGDAHIGGAPFNFAAHSHLCGLQAALVSSLGLDELGACARREIAALGVDERFVFTHRMLPTGTVAVTLVGGVPSYEIKRPVAWDEIAFPAGGARPAKPRALYFGTLAQRSPVSAATLAELVREFPDALTFFDVNLRQNFWSRGLVENGLAFTDILKVSDEEVERLGLEPARLFARFPRLKIVVETRGKDGCCVTPRDGEGFSSSAVDAGPVVDTVGAGDSFSAAFLTAMLNGASLREAAIAGNRRAGQVVARAGAVPVEMRAADKPKIR
jgi:fructokinase